MSFSENTSDSDWKEAKIKVERHIKREASKSNANLNNSGGSTGSGKQKYCQKFCEKWLNLFNPWLARSAEDRNKPFCRACQCRLDCNRCHLVRHERTTKHKRNLEALITKGEGAVKKELSVRRERSKYYHQRKRARQALREEAVITQETEPYEEVVAATVNITDNVAVVSAAQPFELLPNESQETTLQPTADIKSLSQTTHTEEVYTRIPPKTANIPCSIPKQSPTRSASNKDGIKLLMQIHQDKNELMEAFRELMGGPATPKEKNHVDLFFESVSSSVKALSPILIAEAKMRVSQLICELELRGLKENSSTNNPVDESIATTTVPAGNAFRVKQKNSGQNLNVAQHQHFSALS